MFNETIHTDADLIKHGAKEKNVAYQAICFLQCLVHKSEDSGCQKYISAEVRARYMPLEKDSKEINDLAAKFVKDEILVPYKIRGKTHIFIRNFHIYQKPAFPNPPKCAMPYWLKWISPQQRGKSAGEYRVDADKLHRYLCHYFSLDLKDLKDLPEMSEIYSELELGKKKKIPPKKEEESDMASELDEAFPVAKDNSDREEAFEKYLKDTKDLKVEAFNKIEKRHQDVIRKNFDVLFDEGKL